MNKDERINDILSTGLFEPTEVEQIDQHTMMFKSIEYHTIIHLTDSELFYISDEELETIEQGCDLKEETNKGIIYCHK